MLHLQVAGISPYAYRNRARDGQLSVYGAQVQVAVHAGHGKDMAAGQHHKWVLPQLLVTEAAQRPILQHDQVVHLPGKS